jgi:hypothetical protein
VLQSRHGQNTLPGLLARQWIIGYLSGVVESGSEAAGSSFGSGDDVMDGVRRFCLAHPDAMAADAARSLRSRTATTPG